MTPFQPVADPGPLSGRIAHLEPARGAAILHIVPRSDDHVPGGLVLICSLPHARWAFPTARTLDIWAGTGADLTFEFGHRDSLPAVRITDGMATIALDVGAFPGELTGRTGGTVCDVRT